MVNATKKRRLKHEHISTRLREMIREKSVASGGMLPTELELGEMFQCSRGTVRRALETLVEEGMIRRKQGSGSYVRRVGRIGGKGFVGLITPGMLNTEILRFFHEFTLQAAALGYQILLEVNTGMPSIEQNFVNELVNQNVEGVVKFPTIPEIPEFEYKIRERLRNNGLRHVVINDFWGDPLDSNHLLLDEAASTEVVVEHLVALGHRRIAWADTLEPHTRDYCLRTFREALNRRGLQLPQEYLFRCHAHAPMPIHDLWPDKIEPPTAIVTPYDGIVCRFIESLQKIGINVPRDVSIVNLNGQPVLASDANEFTCAASPVPAMVSKALDLVLNGNVEGPVCRYLYPPRFLEGMSSAPLETNRHSMSPDERKITIMR